MAAKASFLKEELCCSVCHDIFKDPVVLGCSHSFCKICLQRFWEEKSSRECPICKRKSSKVMPPLNLVLKNIVESYLNQKTEGEAAEKSEDHCSLHGEKLVFFCENDQEALCVMCQAARKHRNHQLCPVEEVAQDMKELKTARIPIKVELERLTKFKKEYEKTADHIREARLAALREEEEQKSQMMKEKIETITRHVSSLVEKITAIDKPVDSQEISFLKTYKNIKERAQCTLQDPELLSGALIDVAKHLGNLKFRVWEKMQEMVQHTPFILDPNTAHSTLSVSDDLTSVRLTSTEQQLPDNPERFNHYGMVLGSEGFSSGKHSWEVEVGNMPMWDIGVVKESMNKKGRITSKPGRATWVGILRNGDKDYAASVIPLTLKKKPQRIGVQLDYDRGKVYFYDAIDMSHIYTFKDTFTERLFPYFSPCVNTYDSSTGALKICPVKVSVAVMSSQWKRLGRQHSMLVKEQEL